MKRALQVLGRLSCTAMLLVPAVVHAAEPGWIVVLAPHANPAIEAGAAGKTHGVAVGHVYAHVLNGFSFRGSDAAASALARNPNVRAVVPIRSASLADVGSWGFFRIDTDEAHSAAGGAHLGDGVRVLVLDSGADLDHPDLAPNLDLVNSLDCLEPGSTELPDDLLGHGTHVAGIAVAAYDGWGTAGVAPNADLIVVRAFDATGYGDTDDILCGVDHAAALAADGVPIVANLSFVDTGSDTACDDADATDEMHEAICDAVDAGVLFVAGAGNDGGDAGLRIPAAFRDEVVTVSALADFDGQRGGLAGCSFSWEYGIECDDTLADFSNGGAAIDVAAPGVWIYATVPDDGHETKTGTSMAAPHVSGVVALMVSANAALTTPDVTRILRETGECPDGAVNGHDGPCVGHGAWPDDRDTWPEPHVNAARAAEAAELEAGGTTPDPDPEPPAITLTATGYKVKGGEKRVDLSWNVTGAAAIEVWRNGALRGTTADDGAFTDTGLGKGRAITWTYQVCASEGPCSAEVQLEL